MQSDRLTGVVRFCNPISSTGMIEDRDGRDIFFSPQWLGGEPSVFKAVVPGSKVEFRLERSPARGSRIQSGGWQAKDITFMDGAGIEYDQAAPRLQLDQKDGFADLRVDAVGRVVAVDGRAIRPSAHAPGYVRAYYAGIDERGTFRGFNLRLPAPTAELAVVLADYQKNPRHVQDSSYAGVQPQSYIIAAASTGLVKVYTIGFRHQSITPGQRVLGRENEERVHIWVVIHERFAYNYDPARGFARGALLAETPSGGMRRDNEGFVPAIAGAFNRLVRAQSA